MRLHCSLIGWFESHQFENAKKFLVDQQQSGENMSTGQIFCHDHGHVQVLLVSFNDFSRSCKSIGEPKLSRLREKNFS